MGRSEIEAVEVRRVRLPLRRPFRTSLGVTTVRDLLLVHVVGPDGEGWGECVTPTDPVYSPEYVDGARQVLVEHLVPRLLAADAAGPYDVGQALEPVRGHPMAKAALELGVLDLWLRRHALSLADFLGATADRIPAGVSVGIHDDVDALLAEVDGYLADGYRRIKLKIEPGRDVRFVRAVREHVGPDVPLQVDANAAYRLQDLPTLRALDDLDLLMIEQPLADDDLRQHAVLAARLRTPVCLDESVVSARSAADAITMGAAAVINIKAGRVGGYLEARRVHDVALAHGVPVWCGGMLETGLGRRANLALAAMPGFTLTGDVSASDRYYVTDLTEPVTMVDGLVDVPREPGIGAVPLADVLADVTVDSVWSTTAGSCPG